VDVAASRLFAVAAWDAPLVRRAVAVLEGSAQRLRPWRGRLEGVARELESGECWSGVAAQQALGALRELSAVTSAVDAALAGSLAAYERLAVEVAVAQESAGEALNGAGTPSIGPLAPELWAGLPGAVAPTLAPVDAAIVHAAAAAAAADDAGTVLAGLGVRDAFAPPDFAVLAAHVPLMGPFAPPEVPTGPAPEDAASWWAGLPLSAQLAAISSAPARLGALDGVPAWARDQANRLQLADALREPEISPYAAFTAQVIARRIALEESAGRQVQLHLLDLAADEVVLGLGDLDTADAVALLVPGIWNSPGDDVGALVQDARNVATAATSAASGLAVATVVWLGYPSPGTLPAIVTRTAASRGAPALTASLAGLRAARGALAGAAPRTTVLAHSYGTVVVDEAADEPGILAADAVVLLGSPGMEDDARSLEVPEVYDASGFLDPVAALGWFGNESQMARYGSAGLPTGWSTGHSDYYEPELPTLPAIGEVVAGARRPD
jgi:hypothetical protein